MTREQYSQAYMNGYKLTVRFLVSRGLSSENAEEAAQAAWAKGWEYREHLRNPTRVLSWVNTIALNLFRNWFRRCREFVELPEIPAAPQMDARAIDLCRTLEKCDHRDRGLLEGYYLEGYSSEELAQRTGCTAVAVRVRLLRVRRKLGAALRPDPKSRTRSQCDHQKREKHSRRERSASPRSARAAGLPPALA